MPLLSTSRKVSVLSPPLPIENDILSAAGVTFRRGQFSLLAAAPGVGKAAWVETPVATPTGWQTMASLHPGDQVFDETGTPCRVVAKSEVWTVDSYKITFDDNTSVIVAGQHEWTVLDRRARSKHERPIDHRLRWDKARTIETAEMLALGVKDPYDANRWSVPNAYALDLPDADLPIDPYLLGVWLGDGDSNNGAITLNDESKRGIPEYLEMAGEEMRRHQAADCKYGVMGLTVRLRHLGVLDDKHIPMAYLRASEKQRLALLQGVMDTDGFRVNTNLMGIDQKEGRLAWDIAALVRTFGWKVRTSVEPANYRKDGVRHAAGSRVRINFRPDVDVFRAREVFLAPTGQVSRTTHRTITSIELVETVPTVCIEVDSPSHLFLIGEDMVPTHNSVMANNIAALTRQPTLFLSADSDEWTVRTRTCSILTGRKLVQVDEDLNTEGWQEWYADRLRAVDHIDWSFRTDIDVDYLALRINAHAELRGEHPHLIVVDNLANSIQDQDNEMAELRSICRELQAIARYTKAHVMALHHVVGSKEDGDKPISLSDVMGKVSKLPELVLGLSRHDDKTLTLSVPKNRGGRGGQHIQIPIDYTTATVGGFRREGIAA